MPSAKPGDVSDGLEEMWGPGRERVRRLLIGLTGDIDLADDLLQETYLRARVGIGGYRGGDAVAWLSAIARNVVRAHYRRRWTRAEVALSDSRNVDDEARYARLPDAHPSTIAQGQLDALIVRGAISDLPPDLREALVLKHYGGLTYTEIAERLSCPVGTAKRRVWTAIQRLRQALAVAEREVVSMPHSQHRRTELLEYLYGALSSEKAARVESHLQDCPACRDLADGLRGALSALDEYRGSVIFYDIWEIAADGSATFYGSWKEQITGDQPAATVDLWTYKTHQVQATYAQGREAEHEKTSELEDDCYRYIVHLPNPVQPREYVQMWHVSHEAEGSPYHPVNLGGGRWRFSPDNSCSDSSDFLRVLEVRLPPGARFESADPAPDEVRTNARATLVWRRMLGAGERMFERATVFYRTEGS